MKKVAIITSGGDGSGINSAIEMISRENMIDLYGFHDGFKGILNNDLVHLTNQYCQHNSLNGKQFVRTARTDAIYNKKNRQRIKNILDNNNFSYLIICGGNGSQKAAKLLFEEGIKTIFIPMTVDNDVKDSEYTIGFDTALNRINQTVHDIHDTAYNMPGRIFMIEVLGGDCGNLALCSAVSSGSDLAIIPEYSTDKLKITKLIEEKLKIKDSVIIICSESSYDTSSYKTGQQGVSFEIGSYIEEKLNIRVRKTVMGFSIRSGSPTYRDAMISAQMGFFAKECILNNDEGIKICLINGEVKAKNYYENIEYSNENHLDKDIVKIAINNQVIIGG